MKTSFYKRLSRTIRGRLRSRILAGYGIGVVAVTHNGTLVVDPGDFNVSRQLLNRGQYDWDEVQLLASLLDQTSRIVFVGAHVGALLVPVTKASGASEVIAYEPSPKNHRMLLMNLALNGLQRVRVENAAVGAEPGTVRFTENRINTGNSRVLRDSGEIEVSVVTLDDTLPQSWPVVDLIVMDVEGFEVNAMRVAARTLAKTRRLYIEFAPEQLEEQGSSVDEFVELTSAHFTSAYIMGKERCFLPPGQFPDYLRTLPRRRGLLLNLLFTREEGVDPRWLSVRDESRPETKDVVAV